MPLPSALSINAWTGGEVADSPSLPPESRNWGLRERGRQRHYLHATVADHRDWSDAQVGWGLVLPENEAFSPEVRASAADAPEAIQRLLGARPGSPVFRYVSAIAPEQLRRYFANGTHADLAISGSPRGIGDDRLPMYLLICAAPDQIPWSFQYALNQPCYVGRLRPEMRGLDLYVDALLDGWSGSGCRPKRPVLWATDHGADDITHLMREAIAVKVADELAADDHVDKTTRLFDADATGPKLVRALAAEKPALVVTTSHGMTGPLHDPDLMRRQLGVPIDDGHHMLDVDELMASWEPDGAIWYAHACCSAGGDDGTIYDGLLSPTSHAGRVVHGVASLGAQVAPLPERLLGAAKPLRAFVGHVEPTFDWTLRQDVSEQLLTDSIVRALYTGLYQNRAETVGMAFETCHRDAGGLFAQWALLLQRSPLSDPETRPRALRLQLTALDRQSMVILGDPTAAPPSVVG
jgi:hypothetical protein